MVQTAQTGPENRDQPFLSHYDTRLKALSTSQRLQLRAMAGAAVGLARILGPTLRYEVLGWQHVERVHASGRRCVYAFWHRSIFLAMWHWRDAGVVAMTSANFDGQLLGRTLTGLGYGVTHGSSSRGGLAGLKDLARKLRNGHDSTFAADGPRGPRYVVKQGPPLLARLSGCPIVCLHLHAEHAHTFEKAWDHFQMPYPFSRVVLAIAPPIEVPEDADRDLLARKTDEVQGCLDHMRETAEHWFAMPENERNRLRRELNA